MYRRQPLIPQVKLKDLGEHINNYVNVIGVVVEFSLPRRSHGTDCVSILKLIDETQDKPEIGANIFMLNIDQLPHIRSYRDIIFLTNVRVESHDRRLSVVFSKSRSTYVLFDHNGDPYQSSSTFGIPNFHQGRLLVSHLTSWIRSVSFDAGISNFVVQIKDLTENFRDIVCKILHCCDEGNRCIIYVWDGTDAPSLSINAELGDDISNQLALHIESSPLPTNILCRFPCLGTILRLVADKSYGDHFNRVDTWVRIRSLQLVSNTSGLWKGCIVSTTKIRLLAVNDNSVKERVRNYKSRIEESRQPTRSLNISDFLTVTNHSGQYVTLMDLLTLTQSGGFFKCIVRFVSVYPFTPQLWSRSGNGYSMLMTLEDPTARIHALLCDVDAKMLFGGYPGLDVVAAKVKKLLGMVNGWQRDPAWTEVQKIQNLIPNIGVVYSGMGPDSRVLVRKSRKQAEQYHRLYKVDFILFLEDFSDGENVFNAKTFLEKRYTDDMELDDAMLYTPLSSGCNICHTTREDLVPMFCI